MSRPALLLALSITLAFGLNAKLPVKMNWQEISAPGLVVVFPKHLQAVAPRVLLLAQEAMKDICQQWQTMAPRTVRYLLHDFDDRANGSATFFPYYQVELIYCPPTPESPLGAAHDWLKLLVYHETAHIVHFHLSSRFFMGLRKVLGHNPVLYSIGLAPNWLLEGMAIQTESLFCRGGRLDSADHRIMLNELVRDNCLPAWNKIWGDYTAWPGPNAPYLFGAGFFTFLHDKISAAQSSDLFHSFSKYPMPMRIYSGVFPWFYSFLARFKDVYSMDFDDAWRQYGDWLQTQRVKNDGDTNWFSIYNAGADKKFPRQLADGSFLFWGNDYQAYPGIYRLQGKIVDKILPQASLTGLDTHGDEVFFTAVTPHGAFAFYGDLYAYQPSKQKTKRITHAARLSYPFYHEGKIWCIQRELDQSRLVRVSPQTGQIEKQFLSADSLAQPRISPNGRLIAITIKNKNMPWRVACVMEDGQTRFAPLGDASQFDPLWIGNQHILFLSQTADGYGLYSWQLDADQNESLKKIPAPSSIRAIASANKPGVLLALRFRGHGYELGEVSLEKEEPILNLTLQNETPAQSSAVSNPASLSNAAKPYRAYKDLLPKYVTLALRDGGSSYQIGLATSGQDLTERHRYAAQVVWDWENSTIGTQFSYRFDGLASTLGLDYSSLFDAAQREGELLAWWDTRLKLFSQWWLYYGRRWRAEAQLGAIWHQTSGPFTDKDTQSWASLFGQLNMVRLHRNIDDFSPQGVNFTLAGQTFFKNGANRMGWTMAGRFRSYLALSSCVSSAVQVIASHSWGEQHRLLPMGGDSAMENTDLLGSQIFHLQRGFASGSFWGTSGWMANLELRFSLKKVEKYLLFYHSLDRIVLTLFADLGSMWMNEPLSKTNISIGSELCLQMHLGELKLELAGGAARPLTQNGPWRFYLRLGPSF